MNTILLASLAPDSREAFYSAGALAFGYLGLTAFFVSLLGILYMTLVVAPNLTQRFTGALRQRNIRSFLVGLPVAGLGLGAGAVLTHAAPAIGAAWGLGFLVLLVLGYAAAAEDIGRRLYWACGKEGSRAAHLAAGWLVFMFGSLFPILGWFLIFPYVSLSGLGSIVVGAFTSRSAAPEIEYKE